MNVGSDLKAVLALSDDLQKDIHDFLKADAPLRSRASSSSSASSLDADKPAGASEWDSFGTEEKPVEETSAIWFSNCLLSSYSSFEYFLLATDNKFVVVSRSTCDENKLECITKKSIFNGDESAESYITCCTLFGLGSLRKSELRDCVVVAIGLSNGRVNFYTEKGILLYYEEFSLTQPVLDVSFDQFEDGQLLTVVLADEIFSINPFSLQSVLLQAKSAIAKMEKTVEELSETLDLECERIEIEGGSRIRHAVFTGIQNPTSLQQYVSASLEDYNQRVERSTVPNHTTFFVHTDSMFARFVWHPEGGSGNIWSEAVAKLASSFVPHFGIRNFFGIKSGSTKKSVLTRTKVKAPTRGIINDARKVFSLSRSPLPRSFLAIADQTARIVLIDIKRRQIVRIFKGYRDATVAWISVNHNRKSVLFMVAFAPRRAVIEIWCINTGTRVGAHKVDPNGVLIDGGLSTVVCGRRDLSETSRAFFLNSDGSIVEIIVPFHLALMKNTSGEQHDQILINKISNLQEPLVLKDFVEIFTAIHLHKFKKQALLNVFHRIDNEEMFSDLYENVKNAGIDDITTRMKDLLDAYNQLKSFYNSDNRGISEVELPYNEEYNTLIRVHLNKGELCSNEVPSLKSLLTVVSWESVTTDLMNSNLPDVVLTELGHLLFYPVLFGAIDSSILLEKVVPLLPFTQNDLCLLFCKYILNSGFALRNAFGNIVEFLTTWSMASLEMINVWEKMLLESCNISRALIMYVCLCLTRRNVSEQRKNHETESGDGLNSSAETDWESFDPRSEHEDSTVCGFHVAWLCSQLKSGVTYLNILKNGSGFVREQVAWLCVQENVSPDNIDEFLTSNGILKELCSILPYTMKKDLLFTDIAWELISRWLKEKSQQIDTLQSSVSFIKNIDNCRLRHGLAKLLWDKFLSESARNLSQLMEKTGRGPKEREAKQHLQMTESHILTFVEVCLELFTVLMDSVRDAPPVSKISEDAIFQICQAHTPVSAGNIVQKDSLSHIANKETLVNYHLVFHYMLLYTVYRIQLRTSIRIHAKKVLFCDVGARCFDHPLDSHPLIPLEIPDSIVEQRYEFVTKVAEQGTDEDRQIVRELAQDWNLTLDSIGLMQFLCYLRNGDDSKASIDVFNVVSPQKSERMARILAARVLRHASCKKTNLLSSHSRFLMGIAGEESSRVEWEGDWKEAVASLGRIARATTMDAEDSATFAKINNITMQYWQLQCYHN